jgi:hypothetical protein
MEQQTVAGFFDPHNIEHLKAYKLLQQNGQWPDYFYQHLKGLDFQNGAWSILIANKMADAYIELILKGDK